MAEPARNIGRANLAKRIASLDGVERSLYRDGSARFELADGGALVVTPPFGLLHERDYEGLVAEPLLEELGRDRVVAALLVRLGGYAVGVFDGERLVASKVGSRFVKGRHKKGGSSANRFRRRREEQERALISDAAETALRVVEPWRERVEYAALGGDRSAVEQVLAARAELGWVRERALPRFFTVPEPRLRELERLPYELYAAEITAERRR